MVERGRELEAAGKSMGGGGLAHASWIVSYSSCKFQTPVQVVSKLFQTNDYFFFIYRAKPVASSSDTTDKLYIFRIA